MEDLVFDFEQWMLDEEIENPTEKDVEMYIAGVRYDWFDVFGDLEEVQEKEAEAEEFLKNMIKARDYNE